MLAYIVHIPLIAVLCIFLRKKLFYNPPLLKFFWPTLLLKILAGVLLGIIYKYHYIKGDTFTFQKYANTLAELFLNDPQQYFNVLFKSIPENVPSDIMLIGDRTRLFFFVKIISILNLFTFSNYWINSVYLSIASFSGLWILGNYIVQINNALRYPVLFAFFSFPSFVLWTSGLLKESLVTTCLCLAIYFAVKWIKERKITVTTTLLTMLCLYIGIEIKYYYFLILIPIISSYVLTIYISSRFVNNNRLIPYLTFTALVVFFFLTPILTIPYLNFYVIRIIFISYTHILDASPAINTYTFHDFNESLFSYIKNFPEAIFIGLFRPFIWEANNFFSFFIGLENMVLLFLFISMIYKKMKEGKQWFSLPHWSAWAYVIICAGLMALIGPNWGTLSRYKSGFITFFLILITEMNPMFEYFIRMIKSIFKGITHSAVKN